MTQILLYRSDKGIVLATDSRAVMFDSESDEASSRLEVRKLFRLAPSIVMVTGGAGFGILLSRRFQRHVTQAGLTGYEEIADAAGSFLGRETASFRQQPSAQTRSELDRVYFLIAAHLADGASLAFPFLLLASENHDDPLHVVETSHFLAIPRQIGLEYRLTKQPPPGGDLDEVEHLFQNFLSRLADADDDVGPPFHFLRITSEGIEERTGSADTSFVP